jgi:uncharacterized membrane protein YjgN (DUF898 family)
MVTMLMEMAVVVVELVVVTVCVVGMIVVLAGKVTVIDFGEQDNDEKHRIKSVVRQTAASLLLLFIDYHLSTHIIS